MKLQKFSIRFCSTEQGCPRKMTDGQMNKVMCSFSSPSRAWQKQCTKVKCPLRPHYLLCNLIARKRQGAGFPNRIYVKYPPEALNQTDRIFSVKQTENCPTDGQKTVSVTDRKLSSSNKEKNNIKRTNSESKDDRTAYGSYQNVFLSTEELKALKDEVPHYQEYIEKLSSYMASSGKQYSSHAATIRSWALRDHPAPVKRTYECKEDESL